MHNKLTKAVILSSAIVALFFIYQYPKVLHKPPQSVHQWRQCDGSSLTMMYVHNKLNIFQPGVHNQHSINGKGVGEFPIIYFVDACIISLVGHKHFIIRLVNLLLFYFGLFYLYKICLLLFKNKLLAILPVILYHSFPIVAYYAPTSLPNLPAFSFAAAGIYYLMKSISIMDRKNLYLAIIFTSLAGLIKPPSLIPFLSIYGILWLSVFTKKNPFKINWSTLILLLLPLIISLLWIKLAGLYNSKHHDTLFLLEPKPIWAISKSYIDDISIRIKTNWIYDYTYIPMLWWVILGGLAFIVAPLKRGGLVKLGVVVLIIGCAAYMYLFFEQFYHHDYYALELLPIILTLFIAGIYTIKKSKISIKLKQGFIGITTILIVLNVTYTSKIIAKRNTYTVEPNGSLNQDYGDISPMLRSLGIKYDDKFVVNSDNSSNISLYLMDQIGWTGYSGQVNETKLKNYLDDGAKYLVSRKAHLDKKPELLPYLQDTVLIYKDLEVYSLALSD